MASVSIGGMFSGLDTVTLIQQLTELNRQPIYTLQKEKSTLTEESSAFNFISSSLSSLKSKLSTLNDPTFFQSKSASSSNTSVATVSSTSSASATTFDLTITQVSTASVLRSGGSAYADTKLSAIPVAGDSLSKIFGSTSYDNTTFSINGQQVTLVAGDTIATTLTKMNTILGAGAATYNAANGKFTLTSGSPIILGAASDTSEFLQFAQLFNNGTGTVTSATGVGRLDTTVALAGGNLRTGAALAAGTFTVNGVSLTYTAGDSLDTLLSTINSSSAGVTATYDSYTDRITLTSSTRGAMNITVADGTSNIASALRLTTADNNFSIGQSTKFTVGSDPTVRQSDDQNLTASELGVTGVTVSAITTGTSTITVAPDTTSISKAINEFVSQYNSAQNLIQSYVKIDPNDLTKNGILASDSSLAFLPSSLRSATTDATQSGTIQMLEDLGIVGNSSDNTLTTVDASKLASALEDHPDEVISLFADLSTGLNVRLGGILDAYTTPSSGIVAARQTSITSRQKTIDDEIARIEAQVQAEEAYMKAAFSNMESAQAQAQQFSSYFK